MPVLPGVLSHHDYSCICFSLKEANHFAYLQHTSLATAHQNCAKSKLQRTGQSGVHVPANPWSVVWFLAHRSAMNISTQPCKHLPTKPSKIIIYAQCSSICGRLMISYTASFGLNAPSKTCNGTSEDCQHVHSNHVQMQRSSLGYKDGTSHLCNSCEDG